MTIRVTRVGAQVAGQHTGGDTRVTRVTAKVAGNVTDGQARITKAYAQVAGAAAAVDSLEVSELKIQVGTTGSGDVRQYTSELGTQLSTMGLRSMVLGLPPLDNGVAPPQTLDLTADHTVVFTQQGDVSLGGISVTASSAVAFSQTNAYVGPVVVTGSSTLAFSQTNAYVEPVVVTGSSTLAFSQTNTRTIPGVPIPLTATSTIVLAQTNTFLHVVQVTGANTFVPTQSSTTFETTFGTQSLVLTQSAVGNTVRAMSASSTLDFQHGFSAVTIRDGVPVVGVGQCDATKIYAPYSGGGTSGIRPEQPTLTRATDVLFYYPAGSLTTPTGSLTLRTPNFGDRDRNQYNRINRESRGGSLKIYRDPKWPKIRSLVMSFSGVKDTEVDGIISFMETSLGLEIGFRDWNNRVWTGVITTPEAEVVRTGTDRNDVAITMEIIDNVMYPVSTIVFTQSASVQVV